MSHFVFILKKMHPMLLVCMFSLWVLGQERKEVPSSEPTIFNEKFKEVNLKDVLGVKFI